MTPDEIALVKNLAQQAGLGQLLGALGIGGMLGAGAMFFGLKVFFGRYLDEKAKNLATKEDVAAITTLAETAKHLATKEHVADITRLVEKAKSLATKEDIGAITREVEAVKTDFVQLVEAQKARHQLRMAALDKRLAAHQDAFERWGMMRAQAYNDDRQARLNYVIECHRWWDKNCLYLEPEVRQGFVEAIGAMQSHSVLLATSERDASAVAKVEANWNRIETLGNKIMTAVALPPLSQAEKKPHGEVGTPTVTAHYGNAPASPAPGPT